jgi:hypothetical protein
MWLTEKGWAGRVQVVTVERSWSHHSMRPVTTPWYAKVLTTHAFISRQQRRLELLKDHGKYHR